MDILLTSAAQLAIALIFVATVMLMALIFFGTIQVMISNHKDRSTTVYTPREGSWHYSDDFFDKIEDFRNDFV